MIRLDDLQVFVRAAQSGSFSAAARQLDLSPALASSAIQRLEHSLGVRLFVRSTRRMRLSEDGVRYLPHAQTILNAAATGQQVLAQGRADIAGPLRLSIPSDLGRNVLLPWLDAFQQRHPKLEIHLQMSDHPANLFQESLDAGLRYGKLSDSSLVALPVVPDNRRALCAAPAYIARHGIPRSPEALRQHNCLCFVMGKQTHDRWSFHQPEGIKTVAVSGNRVSDDSDIARRWAVAGCGIVYKSRLDLWPDLAAGRLVDLLPSEYCQPTPLQLVAPHRSAVTPVIHLLQHHLIECFDNMLKSHAPGA